MNLIIIDGLFFLFKKTDSYKNIFHINDIKSLLFNIFFGYLVDNIKNQL